jgi:hypothetical protein
MRSFIFAKLQILFCFFVLCILCISISGQEWRTVHSGVEYAQLSHKLGDDAVKINLLRVDLTKVRLDVHHAFDKALGVEPTSAIAKRHRAIAAINAGFFRLDKSRFAGEAAGLLMIDGELLSESSNNRIAFFATNGPKATSVAFSHITVNDQIQIAREQFYFVGVNRERKAVDVVRYTPEFGNTTMTDPAGVEVVVRNGKIFKVNDRNGNSTIPPDGYVISASGTHRDQLLKVGRVGMRVKLWTVAGPMAGAYSADTMRATTAFDNAEDIVAGVPQLIKNGNIDITWATEKAGRSFAETRHPRTAIAKLNDGKFLMITVDGRQPGVSVGMTLQELADYLFSLGAVDAMNLDGGGSTTMFLDGKVVNTPSDKEGERKVSDAIVVTLRKKS